MVRKSSPSRITETTFHLNEIKQFDAKRKTPRVMERSPEQKPLGIKVKKNQVYKNILDQENVVMDDPIMQKAKKIKQLHI